MKQEDNSNQKYSVLQIVEDIRKKIIEHVFVPDEKLVEVQLSQIYNTSRTTIREAFRILETDGIVKHTENRGVRVASISMDDSMKSMEITQELYCMAVRKAAIRITREEIQELRELDKNFLNAEKKEERNRLDLEFHNLIVHYADNKPLEEHCRLIDKNFFLTGLILPINDIRISHSYDEHENIIDALELRDPELAEECMRLHYIYSRRSIHDKIKKYYEECKTIKKKK